MDGTAAIVEGDELIIAKIAHPSHDADSEYGEVPWTRHDWIFPLIVHICFVMNRDLHSWIEAKVGVWMQNYTFCR